MSKLWASRCMTLLIEDRGTKTRFLRPLLQQIRRQGHRWLPTEGQLRIIRPMWAAHERRIVENITGMPAI